MTLVQGQNSEKTLADWSFFPDATPERDATSKELELGKKLKLFVVTFDGTRNDKDSTMKGYKHTNPDILYDLIKNSNQVVAKYHADPGASPYNDNMLERIYDSATWSSCVS